MYEASTFFDAHILNALHFIHKFTFYGEHLVEKSRRTTEVDPEGLVTGKIFLVYLNMIRGDLKWPRYFLPLTVIYCPYTSLLHKG